MKKQTNTTSKAHLIRCTPYLLLLVAGAVMASLVPQQPTKALPRTLTFAERVSYQRAIEEIYWRHRIWPKENPGAKPSLDAVLSPAQLEQKVEDYLLSSQAVEDDSKKPVSAEQLQAEMERMASQSKQPEVLRELFRALANDPFVVAECLARPALTARMTAAQGLVPSKTGLSKPGATVVAAVNANYTLPKVADRGNGCADDTWTPTSVTNAPGPRYATAVWTGAEMIVWGGQDLNGPLNTGGRYNPSTDSWTTTSIVNAPTVRTGHTAIWTGTEMIVWGGLTFHGSDYSYLNTGGRYDPSTDSWTPTSTTNVPAERNIATAVWTGTEMIVWGGYNLGPALNTGGRYNPKTDSWKATSLAGAPSIRYDHTSVWTGSEMIVWGGYYYASSPYLNTGGRYDPVTDTWQDTTTNNAPTPREGQAAVWSGFDMVVWGGGNDTIRDSSGGKYDPFTDSWTATSTVNAPSPRFNESWVWTGSELIVWGGDIPHGDKYEYLNTGGRYNPFTDSWLPTSTVDAPAARLDAATVWTGSQMIVWGGDTSKFFKTGGKYCAEVGPTPAPTPVPITLHGGGNKVKGVNSTHLAWSGANSSEVDVYRDNAVIATTPNDNFYLDSIGNGNAADYTYKVCEAGSQICSNPVVVSFLQSIDATWSANPVSGDWNDPRNWVPQTVPNGPFAKATFNTSTVTDISLSGEIAVQTILFKPGASAFTITLPDRKNLTLTGAGVTNTSAQQQNLVIKGAVITFQNSATAGDNAVYSCDGTVNFFDSSNAGKSMFVFSGSNIRGFGGAGAVFRDNASGADATFVLEGGNVAGAYGGSVSFFDGHVSAGTATIIANGATVAGALGGQVDFFAILPSEPTIIGNGGVNGGTGAVFTFFEDIPGNLAHFQLNGDAFLDISIAGDVTIGSLAGDGLVDLGDFTLTVGGNNQDTLFSGSLKQINTEGGSASVKKVGSGVLRLSHGNTFKGGITINGGAVSIENQTGSGSGSGGVTVLEGTLAGNGSISSGVTVGTGSGTGAFLAPGATASQPRTLTENYTTFKADATYTYKINSRKGEADRLIANGVTIEPGAQFVINAIWNKKLAAGKVFTAIKNTFTDPISGTFSNLPDSGTVTIGNNTFQANYEGGDGNDLTLTVLP